MIELITNNTIAVDSPDHIQPHGTANDNSTCHEHIDETIQYFKTVHNLDKISVLDLGCAGGQLVADYLDRGHLAVGLEGSDYSAIRSRANWKHLHNVNLFTCDITYPYELRLNGERILFDLITAWEVVEHIARDDLEEFFRQIYLNLAPHGKFLASISFHEDVINGVALHQTVAESHEWYTEIFPEVLENIPLRVLPYSFNYTGRGTDLTGKDPNRPLGPYCFLVELERIK